MVPDASRAQAARGVPWRLDPPTRPAYLLGPDELGPDLRAIAALRPGSARVLDIGDSTEGRDIEALVLGDHPDDPAVPRLLHVAGIHPRETANGPALRSWARDTLAAASAGDPARLALLGARTIVLVPDANPDAHAVVVRGLETGDRGDTWRRTTSGGVDLNRNFDGAWGAGSDVPGDPNFRGRAPASEPETQALQRFATALRPSAVYDWHSPGGVVLAAGSGGAASDAAAAAADLVARATGYPVSTSDAYWDEPRGGTFKDFATHRLQVPALTIETGAAHHQSDAQFADTRARMSSALDALAATVDGRHAPPAGAEQLASPTPAAPFVPAEHTQGTVVRETRPAAAPVAASAPGVA